jgi:hypothetical protein
MSRHNYSSPFRCQDRESSTYRFISASLSAAAASARGQHRNVLIYVIADCMIWNVRETTEVSIYAWQTESKTSAEIYELFDAEVDQVLIDRHESNEPHDHATPANQGVPPVTTL